MSVEVRRGDLADPQVLALLALHAQGMLASSPKDSTHFLDVSALQGSDVTFWTAHVAGDLAGCGALKQLDPRHGEIKSMRTHPDHLRQGVAAALLATVLATARDRGYTRLSLETGTGAAFDAAGSLYERHGFTDTEPFADYQYDPFSRYMTLAL